MAGNATKKQVKANRSVLNQLYYVTVPLTTLALYRSWPHYIRFFLYHVPFAVAVFVLDKFGRPKYDSAGQLTSEGVDLRQSGGVVEYLFDAVYLTWFGDLGKVLFNTGKFWLLWWGVPIYLGVKLFALKQKFMPSMPRAGGSQNSTNEQQTKSKRQLKREKRENKGKR
ncbi:Snd2p KNAG_0L00260 [Huiozyma naganishii CBS 8797]|uniref:DUF788 domain protein n=1 Tax=Huiozyma naganishii (strain ATCC MYA-139 / BCRC 22969 / CBS 8797 / KCTC 17520 / NBRC 10181 / NCYC 3082 / Yp74L-3) TaxID=1071383 RepID=J7SAD0_HUIN7|nr:hypothetical protein KNAG_0L00260 [Kazachstania naganishii CBS 8797]CCK72649.1 hypothetical protein KNAG_0L00260 [Kazachstania naganishii CBS 8797]